MTGGEVERPFNVGDPVYCVDTKARGDWAAFWIDDEYAADLLNGSRRYIVAAMHPPIDGIPEWGVDIGVGTPDGGRWWGANRFRRCLLREPSRAHLLSETPNG